MNSHKSLEIFKRKNLHNLANFHVQLYSKDHVQLNFKWWLVRQNWIHHQSSVDDVSHAYGADTEVIKYAHAHLGSYNDHRKNMNFT